MTPQQLSHIAYHSRLPVGKSLLDASLPDYTPMIPHFNLENVCKPGSTLLWDLVQDDKIVGRIVRARSKRDKIFVLTSPVFWFQSLLAENIAFEAEKILFGLICYNTDKEIKIKFIEGCLENVQKNRYSWKTLENESR